MAYAAIFVLSITTKNTTITHQKFNNWLDTFISEKNIDVCREFDIAGHYGLNVQIVLEHIKVTSLKEKQQIKTILVKIDFANGDVYHFFEHLANGLASQCNIF